MSGASEDNRNDGGGTEVRVQLPLSLLHPDLPPWSVCQLLQPNGRGQVPHPLQEMSWVLLLKSSTWWTVEQKLNILFMLLWGYSAEVSDLLLALCRLELRSFLQTLLDLLQRAEDYIRDKVDLTFFTQTLPQLVEHIYSTAFTHTRERRDLSLSHGLTQIEGTWWTDYVVPSSIQTWDVWITMQTPFHSLQCVQCATFFLRFIGILRNCVVGDSCNGCFIPCRTARWRCGSNRAGSFSSSSSLIQRGGTLTGWLGGIPEKYGWGPGQTTQWHIYRHHLHKTGGQPFLTGRPFVVFLKYPNMDEFTSHHFKIVSAQSDVWLFRNPLKKSTV